MARWNSWIEPPGLHDRSPEEGSASEFKGGALACLMLEEGGAVGAEGNPVRSWPARPLVTGEVVRGQVVD